MDQIKVKQEPGINGSVTKKSLTSPLKTSKECKSNSRPTTSTSINRMQSKIPIGKTPIVIKQEQRDSSWKSKHKHSSSSGSNIGSSNSEKGSAKKQNHKLHKSVANNNKILEFMIDVPELTDAMHNDDSSKFSSPFNSRVDTAGTNLTFLTKGNTEAEDFKSGVDHGLKHSHQNDNIVTDLMKEKGNYNISRLQFRESSDQGDSGDNLSFISSPCVERKIKQKRKIFEDEVKSTKKQKLNIFNNSDRKISDSRDDKENSFNSTNATDGSDEPVPDIAKKRPGTPKKYIVDVKPIYEYMEGEDEIYYEIMGKKSREKELDSNEQQFFEFVHMNFEQWSEQSTSFIKEYDALMKRVILARLRFDKRVKFLKDNLDTFALNLEKYGTEVNKRSEILKEYCSKIVDEID